MISSIREVTRGVNSNRGIKFHCIHSEGPRINLIFFKYEYELADHKRLWGNPDIQLYNVRHVNVCKSTGKFRHFLTSLSDT